MKTYVKWGFWMLHGKIHKSIHHSILGVPGTNMLSYCNWYGILLWFWKPLLVPNEWLPASKKNEDAVKKDFVLQFYKVNNNESKASLALPSFSLSVTVWHWISICFWILKQLASVIECWSIFLMDEQMKKLLIISNFDSSCSV